MSPLLFSLGRRASACGGSTALVTDGSPGSLQEGGVAERMGQQARAHEQKHFSRDAFGDKLDTIAVELVTGKAKQN